MNKAQKYNNQVSRYERERENQPQFFKQRKDLLQDIQGSILEVAPGPGLNFDFYSQITQLTAIDISPAMITSAEEKWNSLSTIPGEFIASDLEQYDFPDHSFDHVVSTCSLCAYDDPVAMLNNMKRWVKPGGTIRLLEHGLSDLWFMRVFQNMVNPIHKKYHGCECNRDILAIVGQSDLDIITLKRFRRFALIDVLYQITAR